MRNVNIDIAPDYRLKSIYTGDRKIVGKVLEKCSDYYILTGGGLKAEKEAKEIFTTLPPGKTINDKYVLGIFRAEKGLVGIVDVIKDFPAVAEWTIGLILIDPDARGQGLGKAVHRALSGWAAGLGAKFFRIGVVQDNFKALNFWTGLGYKKAKEVEMNFEEKKHIVNVMRLQL